MSCHPNQLGSESERIGKVSFNRSTSRGSGRFGKVFTGKYKNAVNIAVKRLKKEDTQVLSKLYLRANGHPNIINYYCTEDSDVEFL